MLQPKRTKFRKAHKGRIHGKATSGTNLDFGAFGLKAQEPRADHGAPDRGRAPRAHARHEARRPRVDPRLPGRAGFEEADRGPHGFGQGLAGVLGGRVKPGRILFEVDGVPTPIAREALRLGAAKLPIKTRFVARLGE